MTVVKPEVPRLEREVSAFWCTMSKRGVEAAHEAEGHVSVARLRSTTLSARHQDVNRWDIAVTGYLRTNAQPGAVTFFAVTSFTNAHDQLGELARSSRPLAEAFANAGFSLYAVGGSVRDALLDEGRREDFEIDFTTDARPEDIERLMKPLCTALWQQGQSFWHDRRDAARQRREGRSHHLSFRGVR